MPRRRNCEVRSPNVRTYTRQEIKQVEHSQSCDTPTSIAAVVNVFSERQMGLNKMAGQLSLDGRKQLERYIQSGPKVFDLLYSFRTDGANTTTFHEKCDNKGPTVTVIYNTEGSVFGGYTEKSWTSSSSYLADQHAFLFRLKLNKKNAPIKFVAKTGDKSTYCNSGYGPTFGNGYDLSTFTGSLEPTNDVYTLNGSYSFGNSYDMRGVTSDQITNDVKTVRNLEVYSVADIPLIDQDMTWRDFHTWEIRDLEELKNEIDSYSPPQGIGIKTANILFLGPVGAGKSSFFNTIASVFRGHVTGQAISGSAEQSVTSQYRMYRVRGSATSKALKFRLCDTRGLEETQGLDATEIGYLLDGHVPNGHQFNPSIPITPEMPGFIKSPKLSDKIHCVCFVIDGSTATVLPEKVLDKIKSLQFKIRQKGVTQAILVTKVDKVCPFVEEDVKTVFRSENVRQLVDMVSDTFGIPRSFVLPVKNYEKEVSLKTEISILALLSLRQMLRSTVDFMFNMLDEGDEDDEKSLST